jgi:hypothetical protein
MPGKDVWGWAGHWARHAGAARKNGRRMTPLQSTSLARALALGAGGVDVVAGGAMVVAPVGAVYLFGLMPGGTGRLRQVLALTILFRLGAGGFALVALTLGWLEWPWVAVPVVDFGLVAAQGGLLAKGAGLDA